MSTTTPDLAGSSGMVEASEHFDVLIAGAGISGVGAAHHLTHQLPGTSFVVLESMPTFGGTWRTHRYPGIRSDSDLYTFGYRFKPWTGPPYASGDEILRYMGEVIDDNDLDRHIRYNHRIRTVSWSSADARWTVDAERSDTGEAVEFTTGFLWMCQGYYRHDEGYTPEWEGFPDFGGEVIHPQTWPEGTDLTGKRVVVIGSGATAATLIPAVADDCAHVTMLQRSPTFFLPKSNANELADLLRELDIPEEWTHEIVRRSIARDQAVFQSLAVEEPDFVRDELYRGIREILGDDYDLEPHFTPAYRPWQQRVAIVPDGDLFHAIKDGKASVVTDVIDRFTTSGILLESGGELEADVVITATGFTLSVMGGIEFSVDGEPLDFHDTVTWQGAMFTGVPNLVWVFGYFRFSWTLRVDLLADFVCRLLAHMDDRGLRSVTPSLRDAERDMTLRPWVEPDDFNPGYLARSMHLLPQQGDRQPWLHTQDFSLDNEVLPAVDLDDGTLAFR